MIIVKLAVAIVLEESDRLALERLARGHKVWASVARRARIVLLAVEGCQNKEIAREVGCEQMTAGKWRKRYVADGIDGLYDEPRPSAPRTIGDE